VKPLSLRHIMPYYNRPQLSVHLTLPYRASLSLLRRGKDFSADSSEGEVKPTWNQGLNVIFDTNGKEQPLRQTILHTVENAYIFLTVFANILQSRFSSVFGL
jgi:hypothetical protein